MNAIRRYERRPWVNFELLRKKSPILQAKKNNLDIKRRMTVFRIEISRIFYLRINISRVRILIF